MEKLVYLLWRDAEEDAGSFAKRSVESAGPALVRLGASEVALHVADGEADLGRSVPVRDAHDPFAGSASFWLPNVDDRAGFEAILREASARIAGYLVTESVPRDFDRRDWPDGARCPGAVMISVFPQPARLSREAFRLRWHGSHTPLALEVHPLWRYVRNVVRAGSRRARPRTPGSSRSTCASPKTCSIRSASTADRSARSATSRASSTTRRASSTSST